MQKTTKPLKKYAVVIKIGCSEPWHFWHSIKKAFIMEGPENLKIRNLVVGAFARSPQGDEVPVKVIGLYPLVDENSVSRGTF